MGKEEAAKKLDQQRRQAELLIDAIPKSSKLDMRELVELTRVLRWDQATRCKALGAGGLIDCSDSTKAPAVLALCENRLISYDGNTVLIQDGSGTTAFTFADKRFMQIVEALDERRENLAIRWE